MAATGQPGVVRTTCAYCGVGCGIEAGPALGAIRGDPLHPANLGRLCTKGAALGETLGREGRLLHPEIGGQRVAWPRALDAVAQGFTEAIARHGPDAVAFYVSGQLLTEDYYVANKLMKGFIGSANIDTNSRLCMASSVVGHVRAFGADVVPGNYADLEAADLVVLVGANLAWCHPVLHQRLMAAKAARPAVRIVVVDPRRTATAEAADLHLPIRADGDVALFLGLLAHLATIGRIDRAYVTAHTRGFDDALAAARRLEPREIEARTGLDAAVLHHFFDLFARTERTVTLFSQGVNQSVSGTDKVNAIINCHLATGRIGRPGRGPFSVTGQPNAMGGREVGGLATALAAHMRLDDPGDRDRVRRFWGSPRIAQKPGLKAVELFEAVRRGSVKALWIMATNPVDSLPDGDAVEAALEACPFVVVSDMTAGTDTARHAHVRLPAAAWGEKDGTVTNAERRISRQRAFLAPLGEARPDWWIVKEVAARMGFGSAFAYAHPAEIFAEHAALSAFENDGRRAFDIGALAGLDRAAYDALEPFQWPRPAGVAPGERRFFAKGDFFTGDGRGHFVPVEAAPAAPAVPGFPFILNTGRVRDHWHTMTRTAKSPKLSRQIAEPFAAIHPDDAAQAGIGDATIVRVLSQRAAIKLRALLDPSQPPGTVFVPMHWTDQLAADARVGRLIAPRTDPHSAQPAAKRTPVLMAPLSMRMFGFAVVQMRPRAIAADYWALARTAAGWRIELAWAADEDWPSLAAALIGGDPHLAYRDLARDQHRFARFAGERLRGALFLAAEPVAVARDWAAATLARPLSGPAARMALLAGRPDAGAPDPGPIVCACEGVGRHQITTAIANGAGSLALIGEALAAGTGCGACRPEIGGLIDAHRDRALLHTAAE